MPEEEKKRRLNEVIALQTRVSGELSQAWVGKTCRVLIEGNSKRSADDFCGRNDQNMMVVWPKTPGLKPGDYADVVVHKATSATLIGTLKA